MTVSVTIGAEAEGASAVWVKGRLSR